jgi:hypothetical protein
MHTSTCVQDQHFDAAVGKDLLTMPANESVQRHARLLLRRRPGFSESYNFAADFPASRPRQDAGFAANPMVKRYITQPASPKWPAINKPAPRWLEQTEN